ncbi:DUF7511 domain-containing protein [Natronomonas sp. EA1]|uniref:DUF7511 domain-containing protein n=1 Tax=Natronomonas sp. EA1 TaxID=3421655 RepID=UPI003EBC5BAC
MTTKGTALNAELVCYVDAPDRVTVYPDGLDDIDRMSTWLSADAAAFLDLDDCR